MKLTRWLLGNPDDYLNGRAPARRKLLTGPKFIPRRVLAWRWLLRLLAQ